MAKKVDEILLKLPKSETINLTFNNGSTTYVITRDNDTFYLYEKVEKGYVYRKSRKKDPCFPECY